MLFFAVALAASPVLPPTRFVYATPSDLDCPSEQLARARLVQNLGADPFAEPAERIAVLVVQSARHAAVRVRAELLDANNVSLGERTIDGNDTCDEFVAAGLFALTVALDPSRAVSLPAPLAPLRDPPATLWPAGAQRDTIERGTSTLAPGAVAVPLAPAPVEPIAAPPIAATRLQLRGFDEASPYALPLPAGTALVLGVGGQVSAFPSLALGRGPHVSAAWRGSWWGVGAELTTGLPTFTLLGQTSVTLAPCGHWRLWDITASDALALRTCVTGTVGYGWQFLPLFPVGGYAGAGGRVGLEWLLADRSAFGVWAQAEGAFQSLGPVPLQLTVGTTWEMAWPP